MAPDPRLPTSPFPNESMFLRFLVGSARQEVVASLAIVNKMPAKLLSARIPKEEGNVVGEVLLEEDKASVVVTYVGYLKTGKILCKFGVDHADAHNKEYSLLAELYCFGEKYQDTKLKNIVIDALVAKSQAPQQPMPPARVIRTLFDLFPKHSQVRKLLVDMYVKRGNAGGLTSDDGVGDFLAELAVKLLGTNVKPTALNSEDYHEGAPSAGTQG